MFYTGIDPRNMKKVYVPKDKEIKKLQRALLQYRKKENYNLVKQALKEAGREDLIGYDEKCIIRPSNNEKKNSNNIPKVSNKNKLAKKKRK